MFQPSKNKLTFLIVIVASLFAKSNLSADLVLVIDTLNEEYWVEGSDTGVLNPGGDTGWDQIGTGGAATLLNTSIPVITANNASYVWANSIPLSYTTSNTGAFYISGHGVGAVTITFTGTGSGNKVDYSGLSNKTGFENMIGSSIPLCATCGSGWSNLRVNSGAVPEPSSLMVFTGLAFAGIYRRKSRGG